MWDRNYFHFYRRKCCVRHLEMQLTNEYVCLICHLRHDIWGNFGLYRIDHLNNTENAVVGDKLVMSSKELKIDTSFGFK